MMIVAITIVLTAFSGGSFSVHLPEADMTAPEIISYYGYPVEHHTTVTADGYHLVLHRIPHGIRDGNITKDRRRPVVFLQHGFVGSSAVWIMNPPSQSAGFVFADAGFDVWMGNTRGNTYSFKHNSLTRNDKAYWRFTFDEVSYYDLEAMIDKVLNVTHQTHVYYMAHSEGCILMLAKLSIDPIFSSKVAKFFALGPMTSMEHVRGIVPFFANNFGRLIRALPRIRSEFLPNYSLLRKFGKFICSFRLMGKICDYCIFQSIGGRSNQANETRMPIYLTHMPGGTSTANLHHWWQLTVTRRLRMYDFGSEYSNMQHYGTPIPPAYEFRNVSTPLYVYWSDADWLTDPRDVKRSLLDEIRPEYLAENNRLANFNHFDFIWGSQVVERVYKPIIRTIKSASNSFNRIW